jgi:hypothetical protein
MMGGVNGGRKCFYLVHSKALYRCTTGFRWRHGSVHITQYLVPVTHPFFPDLERLFFPGYMHCTRPVGSRIKPLLLRESRSPNCVIKGDKPLYIVYTGGVAVHLAGSRANGGEKLPFPCSGRLPTVSMHLDKAY